MCSGNRGCLAVLATHMCWVVGLSVGGLSFAADAKVAGDIKATASTPHRPSTQIVKDISTTIHSIPNYRMTEQLDPKFIQAMDKEVGPSMQRLVELTTELEKADPTVAATHRYVKCEALTRLALYGHDDARRSLNSLSTSAVPADTVLGKTGLMMYRWWSSPDPGTQKAVVTEFASLAKENPKDNMLLHAALDMARYRASSDQLANQLRDIVDQDMTGTAAMKYRNQPYKLGRPFKISIRSLDGKQFSTASWKGKVVLIDFWATWCPPCRAALPDLIKLYQTNHEKGLEVLGISNDSSVPDLKKFLAENKDMVWPESFNPGGADGWNVLSPQMGVTAIPATFLIDRNGILRDIEVAHLDQDLVSRLLDETPNPALSTELAAKDASTPTDAPAPEKAEPVPAAQSDAPAKTETAAKAAPAVDVGDKLADSMLSVAKSYIAAGRFDRAKEKLDQVIEKYPKSAAAVKAKQLAAEIAGK